MWGVERRPIGWRVAVRLAVCPGEVKVRLAGMDGGWMVE